MASALVGFLALGALQPVTRAFVEIAYAGYARQAISFDLDVPTGGGAVETGGDVLRNNADIVFAKPAGLDWPPANAAAVFAAAVGGSPSMVIPLGAHGGIAARAKARTIRAGSIVLAVRDDTIESAFGGRLVLAGFPAIVGGVLIFSSFTPPVVSAPGGGNSNSADLSDPNNAYFVALAA